MEDLDRIELASLTELFENTDAELAQKFGVCVFLEEGCAQFVCPGVDHLFFNRTLRAPNNQEVLRKVMERYRQARVQRYFVHPESGQTDTSEFEAVGLFRYRRGWVKFVRDASPPAPVACQLEIRPLAEGEFAEGSEILAQGFDIPPNGVAMLRSGVRGKSWHILGAFEKGLLGAIGVLFTHEGVAYFGFAATRPEYRGRGAQSALIATRIELARKLGCHTLVTETGEAVANEPNPSYKNLLRAGFRPHSVRPNFTLKGVSWSRSD